jgi:hypothetical protein
VNKCANEMIIRDYLNDTFHEVNIDFYLFCGAMHDLIVCRSDSETEKVSSTV